MTMINDIKRSNTNNILSDSNRKLDSEAIFNSSKRELEKYLKTFFKEQSRIQVFSKRLKKFYKELWKIYILERNGYSNEEIMKLLGISKEIFNKSCNAIITMLAIFSV